VANFKRRYRIIIIWVRDVPSLFARQRTLASPARSMYVKLPGNLGMILLAVWLILYGVLTAPFLRLSFDYSGHLLAILAIVVGVLLLLKR
jgi:hypothetical protein